MHTTAIIARRHRGLGLITALGVTLGALLSATAARAEEPASDPSAKAGSSPSPPGEKSGAAAGDAGDKTRASSNDLREDPLKRYYFLGVRFRDLVMPQFLLQIFASGGSTGNAWLIGPELSTRKGSLEIDISLAYADYGYGPALFKGKNEQDIAYEIVKSDLKLGYLTFDLLYDVPLDRSGMFSFLIGAGIGVGVVAGELYRDQAYPTTATADPNDLSKWKKCQFAGDGGAMSAYCDKDNNHYFANGKDYPEKSWIDGGSKPVVIPWLSLPQLSLRFKPHRHFQARLDAGFSISGFFTGLSAGYGF